MRTKVILTFCFILFLSIPLCVQAQYKNYSFEEAGLTLSYPSDWKVQREHVLLLLMPQPEDLTLNIELTEEVDLEHIVQESFERLKSIYPGDSVVITEFEINRIPAKQIDCITKDELIIKHLYILTPKDKILYANLEVPLTVFKKYKEPLKKIIQSFTKID
ncbi:MAG: hypothetical protein FJ216_06490 [Ignavibacteria bacterium]|nr:hypothetical protein [Ignavibacteria bacterium]